MKIEVTFDEKDIEELLIEKVQSMGVKANKCSVHASFGRFDKAEVWFEEPIQPAPAQEPEVPRPTQGPTDRDFDPF